MFRKMALETLGCFGKRAAGLLELDADTEAECRKWGGSQTASLKAFISFLFMASEEKKSQMLIFLVPTHSLTMNRKE